ncbi:hypothetical protein ACDH50_19865, partial [Xanthomonas fragariae]
RSLNQALADGACLTVDRALARTACGSARADDAYGVKLGDTLGFACLPMDFWIIFFYLRNAGSYFI